MNEEQGMMGSEEPGESTEPMEPTEATEHPTGPPMENTSGDADYQQPVDPADADPEGTSGDVPTDADSEEDGA